MKIKGITVGTPMPRSNWDQEDPSKADYIMNKPSVVLKRGTGQDSVEQAISDKWNGTGNNPYPQATNRGAVAMGKYTQATGKEAMAVNYSTKANGAKSFAANSSTEANAEYSAVFGHTSKVADTAPAGFVTGIGNHAKSQAQMITGRFNKDDNGALFIVGDGRSDNDRSNAFAVYPEVYGGEGASMRLGDNLLKHSDLAQMIFAIKNPQFERYSMGGTNTYNLVHINGIGNTVKGGSYSTVLGAGHEVNASYAVALNRNNKVTADNAFAANDNNKATNIHATAFGYENESSGICSFALGGNKNKVSGANSVVTGHMNIASGNEQFVAGRCNQEDPDALFIVGNGTSNDNRSNAFVAKKDGSICVGGLRIGASDNVPVVESFADVTSLATSILQKMTLPGVYTQVVHSDLSTTGMGLLTIAAADGIDGCYSASIKLQVGEYEFLSGALDESRKGEWYGFDWHQVSATVCNDMDCIEPVRVKRIHLGSFPAVGSNGINTIITGKTLKDITIVDVSVTAQNESYAYKLPCYNNGFAVADVELQCMEDVIAVIVTPRKDLTGYKGCITVKWIEN